MTGHTWKNALTTNDATCTTCSRMALGHTYGPDGPPPGDDCPGEVTPPPGISQSVWQDFANREKAVVFKQEIHAELPDNRAHRLAWLIHGLYEQRADSLLGGWGKFQRRIAEVTYGAAVDVGYNGTVATWLIMIRKWGHQKQDPTLEDLQAHPEYARMHELVWRL